jgi:hypothetical protein
MVWLLHEWSRPQGSPRYLRERLRGEHGEATEAEETDPDRVR